MLKIMVTVAVIVMDVVEASVVYMVADAFAIVVVAGGVFTLERNKS